jgi:hypothetical protein
MYERCSNEISIWCCQRMRSVVGDDVTVGITRQQSTAGSALKGAGKWKWGECDFVRCRPWSRIRPNRTIELSLNSLVPKIAIQLIFAGEWLLYMEVRYLWDGGAAGPSEVPYLSARNEWWGTAKPGLHIKNPSILKMEEISCWDLSKYSWHSSAVRYEHCYCAHSLAEARISRGMRPVCPAQFLEHLERHQQRVICFCDGLWGAVKMVPPVSADGVSYKRAVVSPLLTSP